MYLFDSNVFMRLHHFYYSERFPSLQKKFDRLVEQDFTQFKSHSLEQ